MDRYDFCRNHPALLRDRWCFVLVKVTADREHVSDNDECFFWSV